MSKEKEAGAFEQYLGQTGGQAESPPPLHFDYIPYDKFGSLPAPNFKIDGYIVTDAANLIFGASNTFKTMLAVDTACSCATGRDWHERPIKGGAGKVLYVATEGRNGVCRSRIRGWMEHHDIEAELRQNIEAFRGEIYINEPDDVDHLISDLAAKGGGYKLIVLDVAAGTIAGSESADEVAKAWVQGIQRLIDRLQTTILVLHHSGWADPNRGRGHSHIWGSFDARFKAEGDKEKLTCTLTVDRIKDHDSTGCFGFRLEKISFGTAGVEHTLIPVLDEDVKQAKAREKGPKGKNQKPVFAALDTAIDTMGQPSPGFTGMPTSSRVTKWDAWERQSLMQLTHDTEKRRQQAFREAAESLISGGYVGHLNSYVWNKKG